jgi:hypothetical protein
MENYTNDELNNMVGNKNAVNYIKAQVLSWFGHVQRVTNERMVKNYLSGNRRLQD